MYRLKKIFLLAATFVFNFILLAVPAFAFANPDTGDHSNVVLAICIGVGALLLVVLGLVLTRKKNK
ncbi:MAG: LPXTG cell wall anchor domain-containing protein [Hydrogenoanaerobacterium sp.]